MSQKTDTLLNQEKRLAALLRAGTRLASVVIGLGLAWGLLGPQLTHSALAARAGLQVMTLGVALFIGLPIFRVFLMLLLLLRERDYALSLIAALVLGVLLSAALLGLRTH
jgi:uncharacterized membrane protein